MGGLRGARVAGAEGGRVRGAAQNSRSHRPSLVLPKLLVVSSTTLDVRSKPCTHAVSRRARASIPPSAVVRV